VLRRSLGLDVSGSGRSGGLRRLGRVVRGETPRGRAVRAVVAGVAVAGAAAASTSVVLRQPVSGAHVELEQVGDRAVVEISGSSNRVVEIAITTRVGEGKLLVPAVRDRTEVEIELVAMPGRAVFDDVEHRVVAGGPAVRVRTTGGQPTRMQLCLPYDQARGDGTHARFLRVDGAGSARPTAADVTTAIGAQACGLADTTAVFGPGWLFPLDDPLTLPPAARTATTAPRATTTSVRGPLGGALDTAPSTAPPSTSTTQPPARVELSTDLPASGVLLDVSGIGPGARLQRCVVVEVGGEPSSSFTVRPMIVVAPADPAVLLDHVRLTVEEGTTGSSGCATFASARTVLSPTVVREAGARHGSWADGLGGWSGGQTNRRAYRVTLELPDTTANLPASTATPAPAARFSLRWEIR
jgi:hypothetical protein